MRIIEPASKLRSIELLKEYFGINHRRQNFYKEAPQWASLKNKVEKKCVEFAKRHYDFQYDLLFYDVTTLYFETFNPKYALDFVMREKRSINLEKHGKFLPQMYFLYNEDKKLSTFSNLKTFFFVINF